VTLLIRLANLRVLGIKKVPDGFFKMGDFGPDVTDENGLAVASD
jgi:hypothetical protein